MALRGEEQEEYVCDSEPERMAELGEGAAGVGTGSRDGRRRRTSDERPGISSSEGSSAEIGTTIGKGKGRQVEVLVLESGSEDEDRLRIASTSTRSKYFTTTGPKSPTKRRRTSPRTDSSEGWPFSGLPRNDPPPSRISRSLSFASTTSSDHDTPPRSHSSTSTSTHSQSQNSPKTGSSFLSALDLLRSRSNSLNDSNSPHRPSDSQPPHSKTLEASGSASSIEILDTVQSDRKSRRKSKSRSTVDEAEDELGSGSDSSLIDPSTWKERFRHGSAALDDAGSQKSTKSKGNQRAQIVEEDAEGKEGKRLKPWEVLEAKGKMKKKKATATRSTRQRKLVAVKAKEEEDEDETSGVGKTEDESDVEVLGSVKPSSSSRIPQLSSFKKKPTSSSRPTTVFDVAPPVVLPSDDRLKCLSHCPLCAISSSSDRPRTSVDSWSSKSISARQTHLRMCAKSHDYTSETISHLVSKQVLSLADELLERRREEDAQKTLFDRAIGKGEGMSVRDVTVVGVERGETIQGMEWFRDVQGVQEEVDQWRKKPKKGGIEERLITVAKEIRKEIQREEEARVKAENDRIKGEAENDTGNGDELPRATGRLRPETDNDRRNVADRANRLLGNDHDVNSFIIDPSLDSSREVKLDVLEVDNSVDIDEDMNCFPPPTQTFEPSTLVNRYQQEGAVGVREPLLPSPTKRSQKRVSRDSPSRKGSLWSAAGTDERHAERVVSDRSPSPPARPRTPLQSSPLTLLPLSTLTLSSPSSRSSSPSSSFILPHPAYVGIGSSRNLVTSPALHHRRRQTREPSEERSAAVQEGSVMDEIPKKLGLDERREEQFDRMEWMDEGEAVWGFGAGAILAGGADEGRLDLERSGESSEEESLASLVARTPAKKTKSKKKDKAAITVNSSPEPTPLQRRTSRSSSNDSSSLPPPTKLSPTPPSSSASKRPKVIPDPPSMPTYSSLPLTTLQKEVSKYGFRPSKEKSVLVSQLKSVWRAVNVKKVQEWENGGYENAEEKKKKEATKGKGKGKGKGKKDVQDDEVTATLGRKGKRAASVDDGTEGDVEEGPTVGERLRELIVADADLWIRILRYEPIHLDEFILLAANNNVKVARQLLIRCLDEQSITFYQEDPTNGQRKRHR